MKRGNEPAHSVVTANHVHSNGMTIREQFAMAAMQAFITADYKGGSEKRLNEDNALMAVDAADELIRRLEFTKTD